MTNVRAPEGAHALVGDPSEAASWDVARDRLTSRSGTGIRVGSRPCNATAAHTDVGGAGAEIRTRTAFSPRSLSPACRVRRRPRTVGFVLGPARLPCPVSMKVRG